MSEHTPGPIRVTKTGLGITSDEWGPIAEMVGSYPEKEKKANAAELAHRWNSYSAMLEALEAAVECGMVPSTSFADGGAAKHSRQVVVADMIRAALAQARGKEKV